MLNFWRVFQRSILTLCLSFILFSFVNVSISVPPAREGEGLDWTAKITVTGGVREAHASHSSRRRWYRTALAMWQSVVNQRTQNKNTNTTTAGENPVQPFGGRVIASLPCLCNARTVFVIDPVKGPTGPYVVDWLPPDWALKKWYSVAPGNWVLGTAMSEGYKTCLIWVVLCWEFNADYWVPGPPLGPGMGTSLTP